MSVPEEKEWRGRGVSLVSVQQKMGRIALYNSLPGS